MTSERENLFIVCGIESSLGLVQYFRQQIVLIQKDSHPCFVEVEISQTFNLLSLVNNRKKSINWKLCTTADDGCLVTCGIVLRACVIQK